MAKLGEIGYVDKLNDAEKRHALHKPFSDHERGSYLRQMAAVFDQLPDPMCRVLDMGCGTGWTSDFLGRSGYEVVGVDIAPTMIELAKSTYESDNVSFAVSDYEQLVELGEFDVVVFFDCLHHAEDERAALGAAFRALRPGGIVVLSEPGEGHSTSPVSVNAMERFGVTEKDMPPKLIEEIGGTVGFRMRNVVSDPNYTNSLFSDRLHDLGVVHRRPRWVKASLATLVVRVLGGSASALASDLDNFALLKLVQEMLRSIGTRGGVTVLEKPKVGD